MNTALKIEERMLTSWNEVLGILPYAVAKELINIAKSQKDMLCSLSEIRLRADGISTLVLTERSVPLSVKVREEQLEEIVFKACDGSLYAYRDTLAEGYVPMSGGIRLGVCGHARYENGELKGIRGVRSLVLRLPYGECNFAGSIAELFASSACNGMLIYAPPAGGKTTVLRSLVKALASGADGRRVCVVDERCEFIPEDYIRCSVDILRGYKRREGIELAVRTLAPEIIVIDEIASEEAGSLEGVIRCGIPMIATAHSASMEELMSKPYISRLCDIGAFDLFVGITRQKGDFGFTATYMHGLK